MSLKIYLSREMEPLYNQLAKNLFQARQAFADPLMAPMLVVPHFALQRNLQLYLSRDHGNATHLNWRFPEEALVELLMELVPKPVPRITFITVHLLRQWIYYWLNTHSSEILKGYLEKNPPGVNPAGDQNHHYKRTWALAELLATLFLGYEFRRPEMIQGWEKGVEKFSTSPSSYLAGLEKAQEQIYLELFRKDGFLSQLGKISGKTFKTLPDFAEEVFGEISAAAETEDFPPVFLFSPVKLSQVQIDILFGLSRFHRMELYVQSFAPEMGLLEESQNSTEDFSELLFLSKGPENRLAPFKNPVQSLVSWAEPDREFLYLLSKGQPPGRVEVLPSSNKQNGPLDFEVNDKQIQRGECRVEIAAAPSYRRMVEAVYQSILYHLKTHPEWKQSDFAILYSDPEPVLPALESVFQSSAEGLHLAVTEKNASGGSLVYEALENFLNLLESGFRRGDFLALVSNPWIRNRLNISSQEVDEWKILIPELGIFRLHPMQSTTEGASPYTWKAGLRRLKLGRIMESPDDCSALPSPGNYYQGGMSREPEAIGRLCETVDHFLAMYYWVHEESRTLEQWADFLEKFLEENIELPGGAFREQYIYSKILNCLNHLKEMGELYQKLQFDFQPDLEWIRQFTSNEMASAGTGTGGILTSGVTAGPIGALSGTRFRVVYVLGLEEGRFPAATQNPSLDLRQAVRSIGDISREEECRWNLMEILANTRNHVFLCYNHLELQKDREIQPCAPLHEILQVVYPQTDFIKNITQIPLEPVENIPRENSCAEVKKSSLLVNYCRRDLAFALLEKYKEGPGSLSEKALEFLSSELNSSSNTVDELEKSGTPDLKESTVKIITIKHLADFLRNPLESTLKRTMGLYDSDEQLLSEMPDEPLFLDFPYNWQLYNSIFQDCLYQLQQNRKTYSSEFLSETIERNYQNLQNRGLAAGIGFATADQKKFQTDLDEMISKTNGLLQPENPFLDEAVMGQIPSTSRSNLSCPAGVFHWPQENEEALEIRFQGSIPYCRLDAEHHLLEVLIPDFFRKEPKVKLFSRRAFDALLFYIIGIGTGLEISLPEKQTIPLCDYSLKIHQLYKKRTEVYSFKINPTEAREYLTVLLEEYFSEDQFDEMAFEYVFDKLFSKDFGKQVLEILSKRETPSREFLDHTDKFINEVLDEYRASPYSGRRLQALQLIEPQPVVNSFHKLQKRFSFFLKETPQATPRRSRR